MGYDEKQDLMVLIAQAVPEAEEEDSSDPKARFYATRAQMRSLSEHALQVVAAGRPDCPLCGRPIEPDGHSYPLSL